MSVTTLHVTLLSLILICMDNARALQHRSRVQGSVVGPFSHVASLLSYVVSLAFEQLSPAHKLHIHNARTWYKYIFWFLSLVPYKTKRRWMDIWLSASLTPTAGPCASLLEVDKILNSTFHWPQTEYGKIASLQCPCNAFPELTKDAFASRTCGAGGQWMEANVSACTRTFNNQDTYCQVCMCMHACMH